MRTALISASAFCGLVFFTACDVPHMETGTTASEPVSIDGAKADRANVELNMGAGELRLSGGGTRLLEGTIDYNIPSWKPEIKASMNGDHAVITIRQGDHSGNLGNGKNKWDLQFSDKALLDLAINFGAGQARLDLGEVPLRTLDVHLGVGQVDLDLTGKPKHDYEVNIEGGIGQANVHLPQDVGIYATARGGIGDIKITGLEKDGDHWQNDLYDKAKVNVKIDVKGGIGEIRLIG